MATGLKRPERPSSSFRNWSTGTSQLLPYVNPSRRRTASWLTSESTTQPARSERPLDRCLSAGSDMERADHETENRGRVRRRTGRPRRRTQQELKGAPCTLSVGPHQARDNDPTSGRSNNQARWIVTSRIAG